ncbi:hypothetical protein SH580_19170 [Coraliomargarita algicola]|uniref:Uncharacterized protein n=1 Tax=Coraliomargarita algicola TaxID=3092156 RepID=A0ABZ0RKU6_9BACT|nr:hypothetical protein [Coraliomargarita sp. J2-16]WPJ95542.1 hypothetical protein SH580_19170 [Coraliomargarita sp. J2-16]
MSIAADKTPSATGVYFCAVLMALLGALLGFGYMLAFPAKAFGSQAEYETSLADSSKKPSKAAKADLGPKPGDAYYIEGAVLSSRSWEAKRASLSMEGAQSVEISTGEINAWMAAKFRPGQSASENDEEANLLIVPGVPNVGIVGDGQFYLNVPTTITAFGASDDFTISVLCELNASQPKIRSVNVRSAKVPMPQLLGARLLAVLSQGYAATEEYQIISEAFARADSVEVVGDQFVFKLR